MRSIFASFATEDLADQRDRLCDSALNVGFSEVRRWSSGDYANTDFYENNKTILSQSRGAGYWLWKPYLILRELKAMRHGDLLVYCDAGRKSYYKYSFKQFPSKLVEFAKNTEQGFLLGPALYQHGSLSKWTKRDCLILLGMDDLETLAKPTIQATWSLWICSQASIDFVEQWLGYCCDPRCLTDMSNTIGFDNHPDFVDHRHDQSVLTLVAYKLGAKYLDYSESSIFKIMSMRKGSKFSNQFLRRIDDSELILKFGWKYSMFRAFVDTYVL